MPPKKKQIKQNGFVIYANEIRDQLLMEGHIIKSMPDLINAASPKWGKLSAEEKDYYKELARWENVNGQNNKPLKPDRRDCTGAAISERVDIVQINEGKRRRERVEVFMSWPSGRAVIENSFYIVSFVCLLEEPNFQPIEVAAVEFSLLGGIHRSWHKFINPGPIEVGYRYLAQHTSELTHKIPVEGIAAPGDTYTVIYDELLKFLSRGSTLPPIHVKMDECEKVEECIRWLARNAGRPHQLKRIYELEGLILDLDFHLNGLPQNFLKSKQIGTKLISSTIYDWEGGTNCYWHEENEANHCALGFVHKYCYCISDYFCNIFDIPLTERHLPVTTNEQCYSVVSGPKNSSKDKKKQCNSDRYDSEDIASQVAQKLRIEAERQSIDTAAAEKYAEAEEKNQLEQKKRWLSLRGMDDSRQADRRETFVRNMEGVVEKNHSSSGESMLAFGRGRGSEKALRQPGFGRGTKLFSG